MHFGYDYAFLASSLSMKMCLLKSNFSFVLPYTRKPIRYQQYLIVNSVFLDVLSKKFLSHFIQIIRFTRKLKKICNIIKRFLSEDKKTEFAAAPAYHTFIDQYFKYKALITALHVCTQVTI